MLLSLVILAESSSNEALVRAVGEWDERWRFCRDTDVGARERFALAELSELASVRPCVDGPLSGAASLEPDFPELPEAFAHEKQCSTRWSSSLFSADAIHLKEAHKVLLALKRRARDAKCHSQRHVVASDTMC